MDLKLLRETLEPRVLGLKDMATHEQLPLLCKELGLPPPDYEGSKRDRLAACFDDLEDKELPTLAQNYLRLHPPHATIRNRIQDILWSDSTKPLVPKRFRRELARAIDIETLFIDSRKFDNLLDSLWILDEGLLEFFIGSDTNLRSQIQRHVHDNIGDWTTEFLFDRLGVYDASDHRFALFIEGLSSPDVRPDENDQRRFVSCVNHVLQGCGVELRETDTDGGYPVFSLTSIHAVPNVRPKNLIFASAEKPDLRFRDAINNDIEIVTNADKVLVYDRTISNDGLLWQDLQQWWSEINNFSDEQEAKRTLYKRLRSSLPDNSPPQLLLFETFYKGYGRAIPRLPALLPEVWLHWDPQTVKERGREALLRFRMDFLLLLPHGSRVVIEVDGKHHYADSRGNADPHRYAQMVSADRELKLSHYEVFRFGAMELQQKDSNVVVKKFFDALFRRYGVSVV